MSMETVLETRGLTVSYNGNPVLNKVSVPVAAGDYIGLVGPNGAGKTTFIRAVLGLVSPLSGSIELFGKPLAAFSDWSRVGYLPQRQSFINPLFPATVREVVGHGLLSCKTWPRRISSGDMLRIRDTLVMLDIADLKDELVATLSGGQQQRVLLARALVSSPDLLVLDEPSTALDPQIRESFYDLIHGLNVDRAMTIILITHDTSTIGRYANKLLYLDKRVVFYGSFKEFCTSEDMGEYFGGFTQHLICHQHG
jgi:zinc transport system ATP-binding protein